jgi:uncharacterized protein (TIGR02099 family)
MPIIARLIKFVALTVFFTVCLGYLATRYVLWPQLPSFKDTIATRLSTVLQQEVSVGGIQTSWDRFMPSARLQDVKIGQDLQVADIDATLSWRTFLAGQPRMANLTLKGPVINIERTGAKKLKVAGFTIDLDGPAQEPKALNLLLEQRRVEITGARINWLDSFGRMSPLAMTELGLILENSGRSHKASAQTKVIDARGGGAALIDQLQLRGDFFRPVGGQKLDFKNWQGNAYAALDQLRWAALAAHVGAVVPGQLNAYLNRLTQASGNAKLWLKVQEQPDLFFTTQVAGVSLDLAKTVPSKQPLQLTRANVAASIKFPADWGAGEIAISQIEFEAQAAKGLQLKSSKPFDVVLNLQSGALATAVQLEPFKLEQVEALLPSLGLEQRLLNSLRQREATGLVSGTEVTFKTGGKESPAAWQLATNFKDASSKAGPALENRLGLPGFRGLSGRLAADQSGGQLTVTGQNAVLTFPGLFVDEQVKTDSLSSSLTWRANKDKVLVNIVEVRFVNADGAGSASGTYQTGGKGVGIVDIKGKFDPAVIGRIPRYIPKAIGQPVRDWVANSITSGQVKQMDFVVRGDIYDFPYRNRNEGQFLVTSQFQGVTLAYSPDWPALTDMAGTLTFDGPGMSFKMQQAKAAGVSLSQIDGVIVDFAQPDLVITGRGTGAAQNMVKFVNSSPITTRIDNFTAETQISGDAQLDMTLRLPLRDLSQTKVEGAVTLSNSDVFVDNTLPSFGKVSGQLKFSDAGFSLNDMVGTFAGGPIKVNTVPNGPGRMTIRAEGNMQAEGLRGFSNNPMTQKLSGGANYKAVIDVQGKFSTIEIESDLVGLKSELPAPLAKTAQQNLPLKIKTVPNPVKAVGDRPEGDIFNAKIGQDITLLFDRRRDPKTQRMEIFRGAFGVRLEPELPETGFSVAVNTDQLAVQQWWPILTAFSTNKDPTVKPQETVSGFAEGFSFLPSLVTIVSSQVDTGTRVLKNVVLGASRLEGNWRANLSAQDIQGYFTWRDAKPGQPVGTLTARFNRLTIPKTNVRAVENLLSSGPDLLPGLDVAADEFIFESTNFGKLELIADNTGSASLPIWAIQSLTLRNPHAVFKASGRWAPGQGEFGSVAKSTALDFTLDIADSGGLLDTVGVKKAVKAAPGTLSGKVRWVGAPWGIDYPTLTGEVELALEKGQFLKVDPGAAKLISVFNLQSIPKRLSFDFSDLVDQGFAFDKVTGKAKIDAGVLHTENMEINGTQAKVSITGSADIASETQDLRIKVRPEINAGLASLAYVAVNPAIGLGTLLAQTLFRRPLQEAFAVEMDVSGSWIDPKVVQRKREAISPSQHDGSGQ